MVKVGLQLKPKYNDNDQKNYCSNLISWSKQTKYKSYLRNSMWGFCCNMDFQYNTVIFYKTLIRIQSIL